MLRSSPVKPVRPDFADILTSNDHIDAVYSMDDETSIGVLQAISEANRDDINGHHRWRRLPGVLQHDEGKREHLD